MNIKKQKNIFPCLFSIVMLFALCGQVIAAAEPKRQRLHTRLQRPGMVPLPVAAAVPAQCAASALPKVVSPTAAPCSKVETRQVLTAAESRRSRLHTRPQRPGWVPLPVAAAVPVQCAASALPEVVSPAATPCSKVETRQQQKLKECKKKEEQGGLSVAGIPEACSVDTTRVMASSQVEGQPEDVTYSPYVMSSFNVSLKRRLIRVKSSKVSKKNIDSKITDETTEYVIIDDLFNKMKLKINKIHVPFDVCQIGLSENHIEYIQRVSDWFDNPVHTFYRYLKKRKGRPKGEALNALREKLCSMHRFSILVDQYLSHGSYCLSKNGTYKIVISGSVAQADEEEFKPCIFEYVFDGQSHGCFHRNMRLVSDVEKKSTR